MEKYHTPERTVLKLHEEDDIIEEGMGDRKTTPTKTIMIMSKTAFEIDKALHCSCRLD